MIKILFSMGAEWNDVTDEFIYESPMHYCHKCHNMSYAEDVEYNEEDEGYECCICHSEEGNLEYIESQEDMNSLINHLIKESGNYKIEITGDK